MLKQTLLRSSILKELYFLGWASTSDLSEKTGKSLPLVLKLINEMIDENLIEESGLAPSTGGRRPIMYRLKGKSMYTISVAMDQFITRFVVIDTNNNIVLAHELEYSLSTGTDIITILHRNIEKIINESGVEREKILGVGMGMPGF